jgi:hypothetical protein
MNRSTTLVVIAVALAAFGVYTASLAFPMLIGAASLVLLIGFLLQTVFSFAGAYGVWRGERWAPTAVIILGLCVAGTWICAFILGIVGWLNALIAAALAILIVLFIAAILKRSA